MAKPFWKSFGTLIKPIPVAAIMLMLGLIGLTPLGCVAFAGQTSRPRTYLLIRQVKSKMNGSKLLPPGIWGGDGIIFNVTAKKIKIEYACAEGEIDGRLKLDDRGNFEAHGFQTMLRGGPTRLNDKGQRRTARFKGRVTGKTMTLQVSFIENNEVIGDFELNRDVTPRLRRCM